MALNQSHGQDFYFAQILNHVKDKDQMMKEINLLESEKEDLQIKLHQQKYNGDNQNIEINNQTTQELRDLEQTLHRTELQLQRAQAQSIRHKELADSHKELVDSQAKIYQESEDKLHKHITDKEEYKSQARTQIQNVARLQTQIQKFKDQHKDYQNTNRDLRNQNQEIKQNYILEVQDLHSQILSLSEDKLKNEKELSQLQKTQNLSLKEFSTYNDTFSKSNDFHQQNNFEKEQLKLHNEQLLYELTGLQQNQAPSTKVQPKFSKTGYSSIKLIDQDQFSDTAPKAFISNQQFFSQDQSQTQTVSSRLMQTSSAQPTFKNISGYPRDLKINTFDT